MRNIIILLGFLALVSCNRKDKQFCACMQVTEKLDSLMNKGLQEGSTTALAPEIKKIQAEKATQCAAYETLDGETLLKKKAACGYKDATMER